MAKQQDNVEIKESLYDTVIIGAGMAGLTAGYMLRDKNILVLEELERFGGRVLSEKVNEATNNIGTQFYSDNDTTFVSLIQELGVEKKTFDVEIDWAFHLNDKMYHSIGSLFSFRLVLDGLRLFSRMYRLGKIFKLPSDHPRWQKLAKRNMAEFMPGLGPILQTLVSSYVATSADSTSAGFGAYLTGDMLDTAKMAYVKGGFQKITDAMVDKLDGKVMQGAGVLKVEEKEGIVSTHFQKNGKEHIVRSRSVVMAAPAHTALKLIPDLPGWKKEALSKVNYGPLTTVSLFLKRDIPWKRFFALMSDSKLITGVMDNTYGTEEDKNEDNPIIYNFTIDNAPEEIEEIEAFFSKSDEEVVRLTLNEFNRMIPNADIEKYVTGSKVTRFRVGEVDTSPEFFVDLLPQLEKPVGNIHFCGDYTHKLVFIDASAYSGMRAARALGSKYVLPEEEMIIYPTVKKWGAPGWALMICNILLIAAGFYLPGGYGTTLSIGAGALLAFTVALPSFFPPLKEIYQVLLGISIGFGSVIGLLAYFF
jgi:oxygen-dependent protoporphyrinogen oxidase